MSQLQKKRLSFAVNIQKYRCLDSFQVAQIKSGHLSSPQNSHTVGNKYIPQTTLFPLSNTSISEH